LEAFYGPVIDKLISRACCLFEGWCLWRGWEFSDLLTVSLKVPYWKQEERQNLCPYS